MHAVVRAYAGPGAAELFARLEERSAEVEELLRGVTGLRSYTLVRTADGGVTVTVCDDKSGTDESVQLARDWIQANAADIGASPPVVTEGRVALHVT